VRLSVCIPTYARVGPLIVALDALRPQVRPGVEIIVADNGSPDGTAEAVGRWIDAHPDVVVRFIGRSANAGFDRNVLDVVAAARGDYCWLFGDDDLPRPDAIGSIFATLDARPGLPHLLLNYRRRDARTGRIDRAAMVRLARGVGAASASDFFFHPCPRPSYFRVLGTNIITLSANVVRRAAWNELAPAAEVFVGRNMIHVFVITSMIDTHGPGVFLEEPHFDYTCNNARPWSNDVWRDYRTHVYGHLRALGYDEHRVAAVENAEVTHPTWRDVLRTVLRRRTAPVSG